MQSIQAGTLHVKIMHILLDHCGPGAGGAGVPRPQLYGPHGQVPDKPGPHAGDADETLRKPPPDAACRSGQALFARARRCQGRGGGSQGRRVQRGPEQRDSCKPDRAPCPHPRRAALPRRQPRRQVAGPARRADGRIVKDG